MSEPTPFYTSPLGRDGSYNEYRLHFDGDTGEVLLTRVVHNAHASGKPLAIQHQRWELGLFLGDDVDTRAKNALTKRLDERNAHRT